MTQQFKFEAGTLVGRTLYDYPATVQVQDALDDGQAQTGGIAVSTLVCMVEAVENVLKIFVTDSTPGVGDRHRHMIRFLVYADRDLAVPRGKLQCVPDQVLQYSLHQANIGINHGRVPNGLIFHRDASLGCFQLKILGDIL